MHFDFFVFMPWKIKNILEALFTDFCGLTAGVTQLRTWGRFNYSKKRSRKSGWISEYYTDGVVWVVTSRQHVNENWLAVIEIKETSMAHF